jgi:hypothetical protein
MAKQPEGIDDIAKAIMAAIKAARKGAVKEVTVNTGKGTSTKIGNTAYKNGRWGKTVKIDSKVPIQMETYAKGSAEYKAALKKKMANQKLLEKVNKKYDKSDGSKNRAYQEALAAEKQADNWFMQSDGGARNSKIVREYVDPKGEAQRVKNIAKFEKTNAKYDKITAKKNTKKAKKDSKKS